MPRTRKQLCTNDSNKPEEKPKRKRITKQEREADKAQFIREVEAGERFLAGHPKPTQNDDTNENISMNNQFYNENLNDHLNDELDNEQDTRYRQFMAPPGVGQREPLDENITAIEDFVAQHRGYRYAQQRERLRQHWDALEHQLTAAYLQSQTQTSNWTTKNSYLDNVSDDCDCGEEHFYHQNVDLIGVLCRFLDTCTAVIHTDLMNIV